MNIPNENIVDIRLPSEWMEYGILEGSKLITYENASGKLNPMFIHLVEQHFKKDDEFYLMCATAKRSKAALKLLQNNGFKNVKEIKGGAYYYEKMGAKFEKFAL
ncbi:rhodanese-like domain-containing protein [Campylobacter fetus]|uniref:Thiosulfate sulfurtransferase n=1 Tax=Campylobacter fetus subsp. testudinum TaxID=1507806 RepID=A0AAX0H8V6_CAMFE|nr:rhodanese-like domain-containing protein [Campylobacter fetus]AGZ81363.1 putative rhodanese-related sulfurtransferase [Campylobacter fetus subsp. testudinum 03-427]AJB45112.1 thiosulfate sulfurtransferase [Campylobacter fetus subsp. testudinum]ALV64460.1 putative rhodanese-related sulfurtransferase [Campylobacter fetus subsp. testudinum Sp3]AVK80795.1 rhodanese-like domain-containing protein [Campylobacter fetus subsp. testudinum]EAI4322854.1 rhodanese-like domain-containing protein [Campyl